MKKTILTSILVAMFCATANASDGGVYFETETMTNHVSYDFDTTTYQPQPAVVRVAQPAPAARPCPCKARVASSADVARPCPHSAGAPVRVKTYSEVIDHYQTYQPVVVYQPTGEVVERRVVASKPKPCNRCGF